MARNLLQSEIIESTNSSLPNSLILQETGMRRTRTKEMQAQRNLTCLLKKRLRLLTGQPCRWMLQPNRFPIQNNGRFMTGDTKSSFIYRAKWMNLKQNWKAFAEALVPLILAKSGRFLRKDVMQAKPKEKQSSMPFFLLSPEESQLRFLQHQDLLT